MKWIQQREHTHTHTHLKRVEHEISELAEAEKKFLKLHTKYYNLHWKTDNCSIRYNVRMKNCTTSFVWFVVFCFFFLLLFYTVAGYIINFLLRPAIRSYFMFILTIHIGRKEAKKKAVKRRNKITKPYKFHSEAAQTAAKMSIHTYPNTEGPTNEQKWRKKRNTRKHEKLAKWNKERLMQKIN